MDEWVPDLPWLPYQAASIVANACPRTAFEWGSGGSTVWLAEMGAFVTSVEHRQEWHDAVWAELEKRKLAAELVLEPYEEGQIGPDPSDPEHYKSASTELGKVNFRRYCHAIDGRGKFDLVLVDGMARASCLWHGASHVRPGGWLVLDKPVGMGSTEAVSKIKWLFQAEKAGHTGTLDPLATGLLPLCFGEATKFSSTLLDADKKQHRVRLDGIDAPESGQPFGNRSKQSLSDLAYGRDAQAYCPKVDRYGRRVCKVLVDGVDVGLEQIRRGMAWHFKRYKREQSDRNRLAYAAAENEAWAERRGLWADADPVAPWDWRAMRR